MAEARRDAVISISEETHRDLYYDVDKGVEFCRQTPDARPKEFTEYHMFWRVGKDFGRKCVLPIKSYLATQDLGMTRLNVWSNVDLSNNPYLKPFLPYLNFKLWDSHAEAVGTPLEGVDRALGANDELNWAGSDLFRVLALHNYGGLYVDFDVVFLRDMAPVLEQEFMYKWGLEKHMINGAIMRLFKGSKLGSDLLRGIAASPYHHGIMWSSELYQKVRKYNKDWTVFPSAFFNTEWQIPDDYRGPKYTDYQLEQLRISMKNPFASSGFHDLYEGAFTWHWHNCWDEPISENSKWAVLERKMDAAIEERGNIHLD